jgi:predicted ester cyclase
MTTKDLATQWFTLIDKKDFTGLKNLAGATHKFNNPMTPSPVGTDEHLGMIQMMTGALQGSHILDKVIAEGDYAAVSGRFRGKHVGEFNGVPATGRQVEFGFIDFMHFENGKLTDEHIEMSPMSIMAQIGALK